ncbi:unnamed protein product [Brachionus calyciflorus]|uniref:FLYWCH-type domain-containing protein n=1 Tax=Brachionus calyciflorus TaxID=104777 RepID=A0A814FZ77_9BILA|nr:unnamed protein product [Brachionus calyciflorus]
MGVTRGRNEATRKYGSYKIVSCGYAYDIDKPTLALVPTAKTIYWKCELHKNCGGRAKSIGLQPPLFHTKKHSHNRDKTRTEVLLGIEIQTRGYIRTYALDENFRFSFKLLQSLAFLQVKDVVTGSKLIRDFSPESFSPILNYFERVYTGKLIPFSKTQRTLAQFPIETWNLYDRVKQRLSRTYNNVENWHSRIQADVRKKMNAVMVVELLGL